MEGAGLSQQHQDSSKTRRDPAWLASYDWCGLAHATEGSFRTDSPVSSPPLAIMGIDIPPTFRCLPSGTHIGGIVRRLWKRSGSARKALRKSKHRKLLALNILSRTAKHCFLQTSSLLGGGFLQSAVCELHASHHCLARLSVRCCFTNSLRGGTF